MAWTDVAMVGLSALAVAVAVHSGGVAKRAQRDSATATNLSRDANSVARAANELSAESNEVARRAAADARAAPLDVAWDELLVALAPLATLNVLAEPVGKYNTSIRARLMLLIDRLDGWDGFDTWAATEWNLGMSYGREAFERGTAVGRRLSVDESLHLMESLHLWATAFTQNLRHFRRVGYDQRTVEALLTEARRARADLYARNSSAGWGEPIDTVAGLSPLDAPGG